MSSRALNVQRHRDYHTVLGMTNLMPSHCYPSAQRTHQSHGGRPAASCARSMPPLPPRPGPSSRHSKVPLSM